ncbi:MAG: ECF transporter S component [Bacillota bacterium]
MKARELAIGGLLTALSLIIPLVFGQSLRIIIPPFSATLASHVPLFLSMLISPGVAIMVGLASAFGFFITTDPVIAARAFMHVFVGLAGAIMVKRGTPYYKALLAVLPLHAGLEALVVIPFGFDVYRWGVVVGVGTALHHLVDTAISLALVQTLGLKRLRQWAA